MENLYRDSAPLRDLYERFTQSAGNPDPFRIAFAQAWERLVVIEGPGFEGFSKGIEIQQNITLHTVDHTQLEYPVEGIRFILVKRTSGRAPRVVEVYPIKDPKTGYETLVDYSYDQRIVAIIKTKGE